MTRTESPNSINTYNQCKRKYYYSYKLNLPRKDSIATITGKAVHDSLENFFKIDASKIDKSNYSIILKQNLFNLFNVNWSNGIKELLALQIDKEIIRDYYQDSMSMLQNFINDFLCSLSAHINGKSFEETFNKLKPKTEIYLYSEKHGVQGYLDAILEIDGEIYILDYKTSSRDEVTDDYRLQLAIYTLMFEERFNKLPSKVGLHFLRHGTKKFLEVNNELLELAKKECELIKINTISNDIKDYDKNPGPLCKWKNGQCSFYDQCFGVKKLNDFDDDLIQINKTN